jgi:hypothetical protein
VEYHEPYHSLPKRQWKRKARDLQAEEKGRGKANYNAVPPSLPTPMKDDPPPYRVKPKQ